MPQSFPDNNIKFEIVSFDANVHDLVEMTKCIRAAYKQLDEMGLRYWAR